MPERIYLATKDDLDSHIKDILCEFSVAEGPIVAGDLVEFINSRSVANTWDTPETGTPVVFNSTAINSTSATTLDSGKVLVTYRDDGNSGPGTACVLTVNGTTITAGTPVVFNSTAINSTSATTLDSGKVLVTYRDNGNSGYGTACVLTVNGTTITAGTPVVFNSAATYSTSATTLDSGKVLVTYQDVGNSNYGTACVLTVNGTTITVGTPVVFNSTATNSTSATTLDSGKVLVTYRDDGNSGPGTACVLTVNGTTITAGTPVVFNSTGTYDISATTLDSGKVLVAYQDVGNSNYYGTACVLTVNGTTITAGTPVVFNSAATYSTSATTLDSGKVLVAYQDNGNSNYGTACVLTVNGTTITAGTPVVFNSTVYSTSAWTSATTLDSGKVLVAYQDDGNNNYGTACVLYTSASAGIKKFFAAETAGTPVVFESATTYDISATTLDSGKVLVAYQDYGNSNYGTACILTINGTTITAGTPVVFESAYTGYISATTLDSGKVLVAYRAAGNSDYGTARILTINGTTITAGTPVVFKSSATYDISATTLDSGKVLIAYQDVVNSGYGTACILTINGTTITAGTPVVFKSSATYDTSATTLDSGKVLVAYQDYGNSNYGTACILTINGTTITAGTPVVFESATTQFISATTLDSGKVLVAYQDYGNSNYGTACVLTVNGTTITVGTPVVFESATTQYISATTLDSGKVLVAYQDVGSYGTACILTVNGTTITAGTPVVFNSAATYSTSATTLDSGKVLVAYQDGGNNNYGTACTVVLPATTINFLARAEENKTAGQRCQVKVAADKVTKLFNNLIPDSTYYLTFSGIITTEPTEIKLGVALSTNKLYRL